MDWDIRTDRTVVALSIRCPERSAYGRERLEGRMDTGSPVRGEGRQIRAVWLITPC